MSRQSRPIDISDERAAELAAPGCAIGMGK